VGYLGLPVVDSSWNGSYHFLKFAIADDWAGLNAAASFASELVLHGT